MKKKILATIFTVTLSFALTACGESPDINKGMHIAADDAQQRIDSMEDDRSSNEGDLSDGGYAGGETETTSGIGDGKDNSLPDDFILASQTIEWTDKDGYSMEMDVTFSPWFKSSDQELAYAAWQNVGKEYALPLTNDDWKIERIPGSGIAYWIENNALSQPGGNFSINDELSEIYYAVGQISIKNTTDGWSFSNEHPGSVRLYFEPNEGDGDLEGTHFIERVFYAGDEHTFGYYGYFTAEMTADTSDQITIVIAHADSSSPNYPAGKYLHEITEGKIRLMVEDAGSLHTEIPMCDFALPLYAAD